MRQLYVMSALSPGMVAEITGDDYLHLTRSLRARPGEALRLVDTGFKAFQGRLGAIDRSKALAIVELPIDDGPPQAPLSLGLCAPAAEAFDASLEAAVQLGASDITPLLSARSKAPDSGKRARWERIIRESCCQSLRSRPPSLSEPMALAAYLALPRLGRKFMARQEGSRHPAAARPGEALSLLVGPEGGFDPAEIEAAGKQGWEFLGLAPGVLRVPVAVAAGLARLQAIREAA